MRSLQPLSTFSFFPDTFYTFLNNTFMIVPFSSSFPPFISFLALDTNDINDSLSWKIRIMRLIWWFSGVQLGTPLHLAIRGCPMHALSTCHGKSNLSSPCGVWAEHAQVTEDGANWRP